MTRKTTTSTEARVEEHQAARLSPDEAAPPVPAGMRLDGEHAELMWIHYTSCRLPGDWLAAELVDVARICNLEARVAREEAEFMEEDAVFLDNSDKAYANPRVAIIDRLINQAKSLKTKINLLGKDGTAAGTKTGRARRVSSARSSTAVEDEISKRRRLLAGG